MPNAREKLNAAALRGILAVAGLIAAMARSWTVFVILLVVLSLSALHSGDVRLRGRRRR